MTLSPAPAISCKNLWMVFGDQAGVGFGNTTGTPPERANALRNKGMIPAVQDVSFDVMEGELFVIMGLSGSGKSTLIRCLSRLIEPTSGSVLIHGEDILAARPRRLTEMRRHTLGMVFQHFGLFPHMTVLENVAYPLRTQGVASKQRRARAEEVIALVGLEGRESAYPRELSGGQKQRVGIARSLAVNPAVWFLDEPFSALDPLIRRQLQDEFLKIQATLRKAIVFITHDIAEALRLADRIAIMRDGAVVQIGTPSEIVLNPVDEYVAQFSRDIPRGAHTTLAAVMEPGGASTTGGPVLRADMTLDAALAACAAEYDSLPVQDESGAVIGHVNPARLAQAATQAP